MSSDTLPYDSYAASPVHRFYQMWQQTDCSVTTATSSNPSGCLNDLFPWVEVTISAGSNGNPQPANLNTGEGSTAMAFYNVNKGDAPYFKELAEKYTINDNFHQSVEGGTGANHIMFGYADALYFSNGKGKIETPPVNQIENPNPQDGTNNYYDQDGYSGGSYVNCSDASEGGVAAVTNYLESLKTPIKPNCQPWRNASANGIAEPRIAPIAAGPAPSRNACARADSRSCWKWLAPSSTNVNEGAKAITAASAPPPTPCAA